MKKAFNLIFLGGALAFVGLPFLLFLGAGTQERQIPTTSQFWRNVLTNEDGFGTNYSGIKSAYVNDITTNQINLNASATTLTATNRFILKSHVWAGPTNTLSLLYEDQTYQSYSACSITGITDKPADTNEVANVMLTLDNLSGTNWVLTLEPHIISPDGTRSVTVTNGQEVVVSLRYHGVTIKTNEVPVHFF